MVPRARRAAWGALLGLFTLAPGASVAQELVGWTTVHSNYHFDFLVDEGSIRVDEDIPPSEGNVRATLAQMLVRYLDEYLDVDGEKAGRDRDFATVSHLLELHCPNRRFRITESVEFDRLGAHIRTVPGDTVWTDPSEWEHPAAMRKIVSTVCALIRLKGG